MELKRGDLVKHRVHSKIGYAIVLSDTSRYKGCTVCKVEWIMTNKRHLIDVDFLDKVMKT